jgi:hypothetical protein
MAKKTHIKIGPATHPSHANVLGRARILAPTIAQNTCRLVDITVPVLEFGIPIESFRATNSFLSRVCSEEDTVVIVLLCTSLAVVKEVDTALVPC